MNFISTALVNFSSSAWNILHPSVSSQLHVLPYKNTCTGISNLGILFYARTSAPFETR